MSLIHIHHADFEATKRLFEKLTKEVNDYYAEQHRKQHTDGQSKGEKPRHMTPEEVV